MSERVKLGVNIDHVATLRQARGTLYPDPVYAALIAQDAGADGITLHLREDRRHIQERDVDLLLQQLQVPMNLEIAATEAMVLFTEQMRPAKCCLVPEKREELTTEGGLDVVAQFDLINKVTRRLTQAGVEVSLFIDADKAQIDAAQHAGAPVIELHTGHYADTRVSQQTKQVAWLTEHAEYAHERGLIVNAGHGLHYHNVQPIAAIRVIHELNIGHSIVSRALFNGIESAVKEMRALMDDAR